MYAGVCFFRDGACFYEDAKVLDGFKV